jgi:hypothetical protein
MTLSQPPAGIVHCVKCTAVALFAFYFDHARLQAQLAGRLGCCIALLTRKRVKCDTDYGRARERLASDLDALGGELKLADENAGHLAAPDLLLAGPLCWCASPGALEARRHATPHIRLIRDR